MSKQMRYILVAIIVGIIMWIFYKVTEKLCNWIDKWGENDVENKK